MEHIHTLVWEKFTRFVNCSGCDLALRFASYDEANFIYDNEAFGPDGPMVFGSAGALVVPINYTIPKESVK